MGKVKQYGTRSRKGCQTCKKRRVKCDETKPRCLRCSKLQLSCEFSGISLTWEDEAIQRGITFGRSLEARNKKSKPTINHKNNVMKRDPYLYINVTESQFKLLSQGHQIKGAVISQDSKIFDELKSIPKANSDIFDFIFDNDFFMLHQFNISEPHLDQCLFALKPIEKELMTYFMEKIAPNCVCCEIKPINSFIKPELNPYLYLIVPLAFKSPLVLKIIIAASATQLTLFHQNEYQQIATLYLKQVTDEIITLISHKTDNDDWDDVFAIIIMLCFIEISVNCNNSWLSLLNYAKKVLNESSNAKEKLFSPLGKFFIRYFIIHEVMGETAWVHDINLNQDDPFIEDLKRDYDLKIDLVFGCSPFLISLIHRISVIGQCVIDLELESTAQFTQEISNHVKETEHMLKNLVQQLPTKSELYFDEKGIKNIQIIAEIKRLGAILYLHSIIPAESSQVGITQQIIELFNQLPDCYMSLLWPLFVIGLVSANDEDIRWFVLSNLNKLDHKRKLKTVEVAREIIVNVWKEKDLGNCPITWKEMIKGKATTISLA